MTRCRAVPPLLPALAALLMAGCALTEPVARPELALPSAWSEAVDAAAPPLDDLAWWRAFGSPRLDALISEANGRGGLDNITAIVVQVTAADNNGSEGTTAETPAVR